MRIEWFAFDDKAEGLGGEDGIVCDWGRHWVLEFDTFEAARVGILNQSPHNRGFIPAPRRPLKDIWSQSKAVGSVLAIGG